MKNKYKIVFIDIDGTLVDDKKEISQENINIIHKLKEKGIICVLCTGRPIITVENLSKISGAMPYVIAAGGAIVYNIENNEVIYSKEMKKDIAKQILEIIRKHKIYNAVTISKNILEEKVEYDINSIGRPETIKIDDLQAYMEKTKEPILQFTPDSYNKEKIEHLREDLIKIPNLSIIPVDKFVKNVDGEIKTVYFIDIMMKDVTKAEAIKQLLNYLNIEKEEAIAIGDGYNDLEMFDVVGYKVAMENAVEELKQKAYMVTVSNNEFGVAKALEKIFNIKK